MRYECLPCPVCNSIFGEKDDIVVCPICGTPHHRGCWQKTGNCANKAKHSEGFSWVSPLADLPKSDNSIGTAKMKSEHSFSDTKVDSNGMPFESEELMKMSGFRPIDGEESIGDLKVKDYGECIDKNRQKYIPKIYTMNKLNRKISWNWSAFFFSIPWLFYRKMVGIGVILAIFVSVIPIVFSSDLVNFYNDFASLMGTLSPDASTEQLAALAPQMPLSFTVARYLLFAAMAFCGMFGNYFYMKKATKDIKTLKEQELDEDDYSFEIKKRGSVSNGSWIIAVIVIYMTLELALQISIRTGTDISFYIDKAIALFQK
ncbi:MAG: RING finger protein [Oscillospiraceae bacterium]